MDWRPFQCWQWQGSCKKLSLARETWGWCRGGKRGKARGTCWHQPVGDLCQSQGGSGSSEGAGREAREPRQQDLICCRKLPPWHQGRGLRGRGGRGRGGGGSPTQDPCLRPGVMGAGGGWCCHLSLVTLARCLERWCLFSVQPQMGDQACACPCQRPIPPTAAVLCSVGSPTSFLVLRSPDAVCCLPCFYCLS